MSSDHLTPQIVAVGDAPAYWNCGAPGTVLLAADQPQGGFTLLRQLMPGGGGPPTHVHERAAQGFYVLEGELKITIDGHTSTAGAGAAFWIPPGTPHTYDIVSETARVLDLYSPGGFDDRLAFLATPALDPTLRPADFCDHQDATRQAGYPDRLRDLHEETPVGRWAKPGGTA